MPKPQTTFKIFAPMLKTSLGPDGKKRLHGVASSTIKDRHGDTMSVSALADMERSAAANMTIFLNHSYDVPEDVAGSVERAAISRSDQDPDIHDLSFDIAINEANPRAVKAWEAIDSGTKLGLSIGAMIPDGGATRDKKSGAYTIDHVELLETSLVGVPANPRSWVEYAVKALGGEPEGTVRLIDGSVHNEGDVSRGENGAIFVTSDGKPGYVEPAPLTDWNLKLDRDYVEAKELMSAEAIEEAADVCRACGGSKRRPHKDCQSDYHADVLQEMPEETEKSVDGEDEGQPTFEGPDPELPEVEITSTSASADPDFEPPAVEGDLSPEATTNDIEPDKTDATVSVETEHAKITVDTGNRGKAPDDGASQEAQASAPENEDQTDEANPWSAVGLSGDKDIDEALHLLEPTVVASLTTSKDILKAVTRELTETKDALKEVEQERDKAVRYAEQALRVASSVLLKISSLPVGRRTVVKEAREELSSVTAVYGDEFVADLKKG